MFAEGCSNRLRPISLTEKFLTILGRDSLLYSTMIYEISMDWAMALKDQVCGAVAEV